jgi:CHC2 zinc finger
MPSAPREIAELVPMTVLLADLGFTVNGRTRRSPCLVHGGSNPTAFAWSEAGLWKCHSCGAGGDKIALVRAAKQCRFSEAIEFLAAIAGVEFRANRVSRSEIEQLQSDRTSLQKDVFAALAVDTSSWREARDAVLQLEAIRRNAGRRLKEIFMGSPESWRGETEWCWTALAEVSRKMPGAAAAYAIASFGKFQDAYAFRSTR